ncbi:hypothetical protein BDZ45DRAFT_743799 [Acephala macrosclerotiorum]|nr:hypothetical protein BDZ45DRAFT_743799 [Acephala macrosclerotiorum]
MLQESLGIAVRTLAINLYKSQARFVFELIQNAEDNDYRRATSSGAEPYIKFTVYPNKIVIHSNEDGFNAENVVAICNVGQSTKKRAGAQQYIGEKGIGFKSARMGLVTPVWEPAKVALPDPLTRMTLTLLDKLDYPELLSQFDTLPDTFLLFLNKLGAITIDKIGGKNTESTTFSCTLDEYSSQATLSKFLIQSDFVTQASRQDVMESHRNKAILDGIAEAFLDANIPNPFWARLKDKIHELLKGHAVLRGRTHGPLRPISQLKKIGNDFKDEFGNALVADLDEEMYLSSEYQQEDIAALDSLGLGMLDLVVVMARFRNDLKQPSRRSRFKSPETSDDWHTKTAKLLLRPFEEKWKSPTPDTVRGLACTPSENGKWTAITEGAIFFPHIDGILIPTDLGLRIVDKKPIMNSTRTKLFITLGIKSALVQDIRALVLARYKKEGSSVGFETSLKDLHFLYSAHSPGTTVKFRESTSLFVFNHRDHRNQDEEDLYFQSDEEYGFQELMGSVLEVAPYNSGLVGSFIHPEYCKRIELLPVKRGGSHPAFKAWLQESVGILNHPRLVDSKDPTQLSPVFRYIIKARPENLLGTLKAHRASYAAVMSTGLASKISEAVVPNTTIGSKSLKESFVPSETLTVRCGKFLDVQKFPFLKLENEPDIEGWKFLSAFYVGIEDSLDFWLQILYYCKISNGPFRYETYEVIQQEIWVLGTSNEDIKRVWKFVWDNDLVLVPACRKGPPSWTYSGRCFWDAPDYLTTKLALLPSLSHLNTPYLTAFFQNTLGVEDVSWGDLTRELGAIKAENKPGIKVVQDIYLRLQRMASFEKDALIYDILGQNWTAPSACLWSKDARVPGKSTINGQYEDLKDLFVGVLKVKVPDLRLLVEEFKRVAQSSPSINDIKSLIWQINTFAPTIKAALDKLRRSKIFPVRKANGTLGLRSRLARFSIIDHQPWADAFEGKLDVLDFSLKEVRTLEPFLSCMEVGGYLSEVVIESPLSKAFFQNQVPKGLETCDDALMRSPASVIND